MGGIENFLSRYFQREIYHSIIKKKEQVGYKLVTMLILSNKHNLYSIDLKMANTVFLFCHFGILTNTAVLVIKIP